MTEMAVTDIDVSEHGAKVLCADGTVEECDLVIGTDGAHSTAGDIMHAKALAGAHKATGGDENPFPISYRALWGTVPTVEGMEPNQAWDCRGFGTSTQLFLGRGRGWFFVYEKHNASTGEHRVYDKDEMDQFARNLGELPMTDKLSLRDVYAASHSCGMSDVGEGMMNTFAWNRTVLVGDAMVQQAPICGLGLNSGVQDVVALVNVLSKLVRHQHDALEPLGHAAVQKALKTYGNMRRDDALHSLQVSKKEVRLHTWDTRALWLSDRYGVPTTSVGRRIYDRTMSTMFSCGLILAFANEHDPQAGRIPWVHR